VGAVCDQGGGASGLQVNQGVIATRVASRPMDLAEGSGGSKFASYLGK
jgi:hypothetical protein